MFVSSQAEHVAVRALSCVIWAGVCVGYAFLQFFHRDLPPFSSQNFRPFWIIVLFSPLFGYILTISHPRDTLRGSILACLFWSICQVALTIALAVLICFSVLGRFRLAEIIESVLWSLGFLLFNPILLFSAWGTVFITQLVLSRSYSRLTK